MYFYLRLEAKASGVLRNGVAAVMVALMAGYLNQTDRLGIVAQSTATPDY
jgi:hypothetical protein